MRPEVPKLTLRRVSATGKVMTHTQSTPVLTENAREERIRPTLAWHRIKALLLRLDSDW